MNILNGVYGETALMSAVSGWAREHCPGVKNFYVGITSDPERSLQGHNAQGTKHVAVMAELETICRVVENKFRQRGYQGSLWSGVCDGYARWLYVYAIDDGTRQ